MQVAEMWYPNLTTWNLPLQWNYFGARGINLISRIRPAPDKEDVYVWKYILQGCYTTQSIYKWSEKITEATEHHNSFIPPTGEEIMVLHFEAKGYA